MATKKTTEQFIRDARLKHGLVYDYSNTVYVNATTPVVIRCPVHGEFSQNPSNHANNGYGCKLCKDDRSRTGVSRFIQLANDVHHSKYDYSAVQYRSTHSKVTIICPTHGPFSLTPNSHTSGSQGCPMCANKHKTVEDFVCKSSTVHGDKYDYRKFEYLTTHTKGTIICPIHGEFSQTPAMHQSGQGCKQCGYANHVGRYSEAVFSSRSDLKCVPGRLYLLDMISDVEHFVKLGITSTTVQQRIRNTKNTTYIMTPIIEVVLPLYDAYNKEQQLLQQFDVHQYFPVLPFQGRTECLTIECKPQLINIIQELQHEYKIQPTI